MIAPWREWTIRSREDALAYARKHGVPVDQTKKDLFSRDGNLWHLSHEGGNLEDVWDAPQKGMFKLTVDPLDAPAKPRFITIGFEQGVPVKLDGKRLGPVRMIETLNQIAGAHGVGRLDLVENRLVGIKSRGVYETPAGTVLHIAHRELERLVLDRDTLHYKQGVSVRYAQLIYDGLWFSTLREALAGFVDETEKEVTGEVRVRLYKGSAEAVGRRSPRSLYRQDLATFGEGMAYDHQDAEGFIRLFGLPERVRALTRDRVTVDVKAVEVTRPVQRRGEGQQAPAGEVSVTAPLGFRAAAVASGIKPDRLDLALVVADAPCASAGVFTANLAQAAPVLVSREHLAGGRTRAIVANAGCANAATGDAGPRRRARDGGARRARGRAARSRRSWWPRPASSACGCRWRRCARASPRPSGGSRARAGRTPRAPS